MDFINKFLTSGHPFSEKENLQKFRFALLNVLMLVSLSLIIVNYITSVMGIIDFGHVFENAMLVYGFISVVVIFTLRINKDYYFHVVIYFILTSLALFYFVLFTRKEDEFRLIAFFLALFITNVLLGKRYGIGLAIFIMTSIWLISKNADLDISPYALSTFFSFYIIFTGFLYVFLDKVERDEKEFDALKNKLKDQVHIEKRQRAQQEQMLLRQCRMASMGEMLDSIAHQWRQPLMHINSVLLNIDSAIEKEKFKQQSKQYLRSQIDEVATQTEYMSQTIEDFRHLFKPEREEENFQLNTVIDNALELMKNQLHDIRLKFICINNYSIVGNKSELMQVIIIILENAAEMLKIRKVKEKQILLCIQESNDIILIIIEDNAGGIAQEDMRKIFDPYFTSKQRLGGSGLGLYIAKIIIERNIKGKLLAENTQKGAKFTIQLRKNDGVHT